MTLCAVWRRSEVIHFASDSRLTLGPVSADIAIKVVRAPYRIFAPYEQDGSLGSILASGDLGMCFAGSAIGALFLKESIMEILPAMQAIPDWHDISMNGIADFVFRAYRSISKTLSEQIFEKGRSTIIVAGFCHVEKRLRAFHLETSLQNEHSSKEVLLNDGDHLFIGSGACAAERELASLLPQPTNNLDSNIPMAVQRVIEDAAEVGVGGNLQYGAFNGKHFQTYAVFEHTDDVHYWRGALDLHSPDFDNGMTLSLHYPTIGPFNQ